MNLYFLLEDSKSFRKVLPKWLNFVLPDFSEVTSFNEFKNSDRKFMIQSGYGYPQIKNVVLDTIFTITDNQIPIDYFVVCWDTDARDENAIQSDRNYFESAFIKNCIDFKYRVLLLNRCFETWLLGNQFAYNSSAMSEKFAPFAKFYDVSKNDPEAMNAPAEDDNISRYHCVYLQEMLRNGHPKKNYSKQNPMVVADENYYTELMNRIEHTQDLMSFREFTEFLKNFR